MISWLTATWRRDTRRCPECKARVNKDWMAEHRMYNCAPGLHQPPMESWETYWEEGANGPK